MSRVILLLPKPDVLQLANCHKYVTRGGPRAYSEIYTFATVGGKCASGVEKLLVIGHGSKGGVQGASVRQVVEAIKQSKLPLSGGNKVAFDTCWGGVGDEDEDLESMIVQVAALLKNDFPAAKLHLSGSTGCTVTVGGEKRVVVLDSRLDAAGDIQTDRIAKHKIVGIDTVRPDWKDNASSAQIKLWAEEEYNKLKDFAKDLRDSLAADQMLDDSSGRKTVVQL
jgi:hypothetical protein